MRVYLYKLQVSITNKAKKAKDQPHVGRRQKRKQKIAAAQSGTSTPNTELLASPTNQITEGMMGMSFSELLGISQGPSNTTTPAYSPSLNANLPAITAPVKDHCRGCLICMYNGQMYIQE